jgi:hypothetical protein
LQASIFKNFWFRNLAAIAAILGGYALYVLPQFINIGGIRGFCMFRSLTGIPCPGCGMGRASLLLSQGKFWEAFLMHPVAIPFAVGAFAAIVWLSVDLFRKKETLLPLLTQKMKWPYFLVLLALIAGAWGWNILKGL